MAVVRSILKRAFFAPIFGRFSADRDENDERMTDDRSDEDALTNLLGPFESYVVSAQSILIWERPVASCVVLLLVNAVFWFLVNANVRFYFVVAATMACIHVYRTWTNQIWPEIRVSTPEGEDTEEWTPVNPQVLSVPEISRYLGQMFETVKHFISWLIKTRQKQPGMFCVMTSCTLAMTAYIGCCLSGAFLAYIAIMTVMLGPGFFVHVYPLISQFLNFQVERKMNCDGDDYDDDEQVGLTPHRPLKPVYGDTEDQELEEFMPDANQETLDVLTRAAQAPLEVDSVGSSVMVSQELGLDFTTAHDDDELLSLQVGIADLPSYNRVDSDDDDDNDNDQDFVDGNGSMPATVPPSQRCTSESPEIRFVPSYFDDDDDGEDAAVRPPHRSNSEKPAARFTSQEEQLQLSRLASRQSSASPSDMEVSDFEVLSESELS